MTETPVFTLTTSRGFTGWMAGIGGSIAFTTYQGGKVFLLGLKPDGTLSVFERSFPRCMGLAVSDDGRTLLMATQVQLYRFDNVLAKGQMQGQFDAVYAPHQTWITGDIDIHDVGMDAVGRPVFANTLSNCLANISEGHSFRPLWQSPFISRLAAEDCRHLTGLAIEAGVARDVTCVSRSDVSDGWRDRRAVGGVVVDVASGEIIAQGLSMPHSPRMRPGKLWLLNSGAGELGWVAPARASSMRWRFAPAMRAG